MAIYNEMLLCNKFGGIKRINSVFSSAMISASDMQNVELFNTGINSGVGIRNMKGNRSILDITDTDENIINIFETLQDSERYLIIHTESSNEGKIYVYNPNSQSLVLKKQGLALTGKSCGVDFSQGWSDLFVFSNGENILSIQIGKLDNLGELDEIVEFNPLDVDGRSVRGLGLVVFDGRLWVFNDTVLWYSVKENCYDFSTEDPQIVTSAGYIEFSKKITAIIPYLGTLAVFHKDSSCLINIESDYSYARTDDSPGGCASAEALVFHGAELYFYDDTKKGVFAFTQVVTGDKTLSDNIALDVQEELSEINSSKLDEIRMLSVVQSDRNEIWFLLPNRDEEYSIILIFDYIHKQWIKRKCQKLIDFTIFENVLYSASKQKIFIEYSSEDFDGEFIPAYYYCSPLNLSADNTMKILYIPPRVTLDMDRSNNFMVRYIKNYDILKAPKIKHIYTKNIRNYFYWDTSNWDSFFVFKPKVSNSIRKLPPSTFKTLEIRFYTNDSNQGFAIKNIEFSRIKVKQL